MGLFIMTLVLFMDKTSYLLNLFVQSIGVYLQNLIQLGWHTDAFEQLGPSYGNIDRNRFIPPSVDTTDGPHDWMDSWTFFYWGWWISFTPFCCKYRYLLKILRFELSYWFYYDMIKLMNTMPS